MQLPRRSIDRHSGRMQQAGLAHCRQVSIIGFTRRATSSSGFTSRAAGTSGLLGAPAGQARLRRVRRAVATAAFAAMTTAAAATWHAPGSATTASLASDHLWAKTHVVVPVTTLIALLTLLVHLLRQRARRPLFEWAVLNEECQHEFMITGTRRNTVEKSRDYNIHGWVIPVNGTCYFTAGHVYRWSLVIEQVNRERPEIQFGIQGMNFDFPWRLVTTTRCSRTRDHEENWVSRPGGDQRIEVNDVVHLELDFSRDPGVFRMALNSSPFEVVFDDIPTDKSVMPAVMLGGHGSRVRVQASSRKS